MTTTAALSPSARPAGRPPLLVAATLAWLPFAVAVVALSGLLYATVQYDLRSGADDPQLQMALDLAAQLSGGAEPAQLLGTGRVDLATGLSPYAIVFDGQDRPLASTGVLNGRTPVPPAGVLRNARAGRNELTWQPGPGVRSAIVVSPFRSGASSGTVLVGRSLTEVERREQHLLVATGGGMVAGLGGTAVACLFSAWVRRRQSWF